MALLLTVLNLALNLQLSDLHFCYSPFLLLVAPLGWIRGIYAVLYLEQEQNRYMYRGESEDCCKGQSISNAAAELQNESKPSYSHESSILRNTQVRTLYKIQSF